MLYDDYPSRELDILIMTLIIISSYRVFRTPYTQRLCIKDHTYRCKPIKIYKYPTSLRSTINLIAYNTTYQQINHKKKSHRKFHPSSPIQPSTNHGPHHPQPITQPNHGTAHTCCPSAAGRSVGRISRWWESK